MPVNTVRRRFGSSTLTSLRLFTRAPWTRIRSWLSACWRRTSNVVHARARLAQLALDHVGDRRLGEHLARRRRRVGERPLGVTPERAIEQLDDLEHGHARRIAREAIAALDAALRADHARAPEHREQLLEEMHPHRAPARPAPAPRTGTCS